MYDTLCFKSWFHAAFHPRFIPSKVFCFFCFRYLLLLHPIWLVPGKTWPAMQHISNANKLNGFLFGVFCTISSNEHRNQVENHHLRGIWHGWFSFSDHFHSKSKFRGVWILFKMPSPWPVFIRLWAKPPILLMSCYMVFFLLFTSDLGVQCVSNYLADFEFRCKIMGLILNPAIWFLTCNP